MLNDRPGFGATGFMAYEVISDLRWACLRDAPDVMTWANAGPGAVRGLHRVFGRPADQPLSQDQALVEMCGLLDKSPDHLGEHVPPLEMRDVEHSLCEFDRYQRAKQGRVKGLERYRPPEPPSMALI
jgi:5-hmdU DNA kinase, helical domain